MAIIPEHTLEEIRGRCDIVEIVGAHVELRRAGASWKALCPFHREKTPSFHVNPARQSYHCFGCGAGGDVFRFVMEFEKVDFLTAVRILGRRAGVALEFTEDEKRDRSAKDALYQLHTDLASFYREALAKDADGAAARAYLQDRALDGAAAERFLIGFAPLRAEALRRWATARGYPLNLLETSGVLVKRDAPRGDEAYYDRFRGRLMFAIRDEAGRVIGFSGRVLPGDPSPAKYVNSPETPLFHKSRVLYAFDRARKPMIEARHALLCEGQIDTIRCHLAGFENAVAAQGTAVTDDHARLLRRCVDEVRVVLDADAAGQNAALRSAEVLMGAGLQVRMVSLPEGEDPDTLLRRAGPEAFRAALDAAESAVGFHVRVLQQRGELASDAGRLRAARAVLQAIARIPEAIQRETGVREAARRLALSEESLFADLRRLQRGRSVKPEAEPAGAPATPAEAPPPAEEVGLLEILTHHPDLFPLARDHLPPRLLAHSACRALYERLCAAGGRPDHLTAETGDNATAATRLAASLEMSSRMNATGRTEWNPNQALQHILLRIWKRILTDRRREALARRDRAADDARAALDGEISVLTMQIKQIERGWAAARDVIQVHL